LNNRKSWTFYEAVDNIVQESNQPLSKALLQPPNGKTLALPLEFWHTSIFEQVENTMCIFLKASEVAQGLELPLALSCNDTMFLV